MEWYKERILYKIKKSKKHISHKKNWGVNNDRSFVIQSVYNTIIMKLILIDTSIFQRWRDQIISLLLPDIARVIFI